MEVMDWLLEKDNPSARYLALRHLEGRPEHDPEVAAARAAIPGHPPARAILEAQWPAGYWMHPDLGYSPRHKATAWQVIFLAALGAPRTAAIDRACAYLMEHSRLPDGRFTGLARRGTFLCLNGSLVRALFQLDYADPRREESLEALAHMLLGAGPRCRSCDAMGGGGAGPRCVYGSVKALGAFAQVPEGRRSPGVQAAIAAGVRFLTEQETSIEEGPRLLAATGGSAAGPGQPAHRFGFPLDSRADLLEALEVLAGTGAPPSPSVEAALAIIRSKQRPDGAWPLEYTPRNTWAGFGTSGQPNKWVTIRALRTLKLWSGPYP